MVGNRLSARRRHLRFRQ